MYCILFKPLLVHQRMGVIQRLRWNPFLKLWRAFSEVKSSELFILLKNNNNHDIPISVSRAGQAFGNATKSLSRFIFAFFQPLFVLLCSMHIEKRKKNLTSYFLTHIQQWCSATVLVASCEANISLHNMCFLGYFLLLPFPYFSIYTSKPLVLLFT